MIPEVLANYRILKKLGKGGMGEVYLAHDTNLERDVAIKILGPRLIADDNAKHRLVREARAAAKLDHFHREKVSKGGNACRENEAQASGTQHGVDYYHPVSQRFGRGSQAPHY